VNLSSTPLPDLRYTRAKLNQRDIISMLKTTHRVGGGSWDRRSEYPVLSAMAFEMLSIPSISAELERAFSQAKIASERNRFGDEMVQLTGM
jgi:hAT family C-terminal dimerisation region